MEMDAEHYFTPEIADRDLDVYESAVLARDLLARFALKVGPLPVKEAKAYARLARHAAAQVKAAKAAIRRNYEGEADEG
jgi:hypothetical protein